MSDVWLKRNALDKERRTFMRVAMADFDKTYRIKVRELQQECEQDGGHSWTFDTCGPLGDPWFTCSRCYARKVELEGISHE